MKVREKDTNVIYTVYKIRDDNKGYPHFLIHEGNQWMYISAKHFVPCEDAE